MQYVRAERLSDLNKLRSTTHQSLFSDPSSITHLLQPHERNRRLDRRNNPNPLLPLPSILLNQLRDPSHLIRTIHLGYHDPLETFPCFQLHGGPSMSDERTCGGKQQTMWMRSSSPVAPLLILTSFSARPLSTTCSALEPGQSQNEYARWGRTQRRSGEQLPFGRLRRCLRGRR
jgi:hypothetical protein